MLLSLFLKIYNNSSIISLRNIIQELETFITVSYIVGIVTGYSGIKLVKSRQLCFSLE